MAGPDERRASDAWKATLHAGSDSWRVVELGDVKCKGPLELHGIAAEALLGVRITLGPTAFEALRWNPQLIGLTGLQIVGEASHVAARVRISTGLWNRAHRCAAVVWGFVAKTVPALRLCTGPVVVVESLQSGQDRFIGGFDALGVLEGGFAARTVGPCVVELQCVKAGWHADRGEDVTIGKMTDKATRVLALVDSVTRGDAALQEQSQRARVRLAVTALVLTAEVDFGQDEDPMVSCDLILLQPRELIQRWVRGRLRRRERSRSPRAAGDASDSAAFAHALAAEVKRAEAAAKARLQAGLKLLGQIGKYDRLDVPDADSDAEDAPDAVRLQSFFVDSGRVADADEFRQRGKSKVEELAADWGFTVAAKPGARTFWKQSKIHGRPWAAMRADLRAGTLSDYADVELQKHAETAAVE